MPVTGDGGGLAFLARAQLIRARHRVQERARGRNVPVLASEVAAMRSQVLAGSPISEVAARFGVTVTRVRRAAGEAWPDLLERPAQRRVCENCGKPFAVQYASDKRRHCCMSCAAQKRVRDRSSHRAEDSQEALGEADALRSVSEAGEVAENGATARPRAPGGLPEL